MSSKNYYIRVWLQNLRKYHFFRRLTKEEASIKKREQEALKKYGLRRYPKIFKYKKRKR